MRSVHLPENLNGLAIHLVGAKGTGMCALAEILRGNGARLSGSDVPDVFYTDAILKELGIRLFSGFSADHVSEGLACVIHSAAYKRAENPELIEADRLGIPVLLYTEALGQLSARYDSSGISGVHGKTTTTAIAGSLLQKTGCPAIVLAGSAVSSFGGRSTLNLGNRFFVAETCEYQRHFLSFRPRRIVITSIEPDHQDYYPEYGDILKAFVEYGLLLPDGGELIFCADDPGACQAAALILEKRPDLASIPYGEKADGPFRLFGYTLGNGFADFRVQCFPGPFRIRIPGRHIALDACAALALASSLLMALDGAAEPGGLSPERARGLYEGIYAFAGSKRRAEIIGQSGGVLFMDDYGHHPTAIAKTLSGLKEFHPGRRIVIDFMAHTYSRTKALLEEFASCFSDADEVILHKIYASAREKPDPSVSGRVLYGLCASKRPGVSYFEEVDDAYGYLRGSLKPGDLFITMGAGDNWKLGKKLFESLPPGEEAR
jgi:UDP-N-acetylmuramate--alanine ligase